MFDYFGTLNIGYDKRGVNRAIEFFHYFFRFTAGNADNNPVRFQRVLDSSAFP